MYSALRIQDYVAPFICCTRNAIYTVGKVIHLTFTKYAPVSVPMGNHSFRVVLLCVIRLCLALQQPDTNFHSQSTILLRRRASLIQTEVC